VSQEQTSDYIVQDVITQAQLIIPVKSIQVVRIIMDIKIYFIGILMENFLIGCKKESIS